MIRRRLSLPSCPDLFPASTFFVAGGKDVDDRGKLRHDERQACIATGDLR